MRIYVSHSTDMNYNDEIYLPLKEVLSDSSCELILPHESSAEIINTRNDYRDIDIVIAECSRPSTGVGIELGWFYDDGKPIYCFCREGLKISDSVKVVVSDIFYYKDKKDFIEKVKTIIKS